MAEQIPVTEAHQVSSRLITDAVPQQAGHQPGEGRNAGIPMGFVATTANPYQALPHAYPDPRFRQPSAGDSTMMYASTSMAQGVDGSFALSSTTESLPNYPPFNSVVPGQNVLRYSTSNSRPGFPRQQQPEPPFAGRGAFHHPGYNPSFPAQYSTYSQSPHQGMIAPHFPQHIGSHQRPDLVNPIQTQYANQPFYGVPSQVTAPYVMYSPSFYRQMSPSQQEFSGRLSRQQEGPMGQTAASGPPTGFGSSNSTMGYGALANPSSRSGSFARQGTHPQASKAVVVPSTPRGPPRKPKQSGYALWVGNLPPGTLIVDLKDHFSRDATQDIESVFLISKSNCAFVNYRNKAACSAATTRFHDSRFQGVSLVCRLRRSTKSTATPVLGAPTGPAALTTSSAAGGPPPQTAVEAITRNREVSSRAEEVARQIDGASGPTEKFFIVKSLTIEDLELSARTGIWATQAHNEEAFNRAYEAVPNVYLIFSGNKTGEYFGYARMASPISDAAAAELDWQPHGSSANAPTVPTTTPSPPAADVPRFIPTPPTEHAPRGRIIDDSARGTIFWEADPPADAAQDDTSGDTKKPDGDVITIAKAEDSTLESGAAEGAPPFGKPFRVEWLSTAKLPFYRTRGLRNPWNANREVKIARDGTELETSAGRKLLSLFKTGHLTDGVGLVAGTSSAGPSGMEAGMGRGP